MPSPLLLALRARAAGGGGSGGPASLSLSRAFLLYRQQDALAPAPLVASPFPRGGADQPSGNQHHQHEQRRTLVSLFGGKQRQPSDSADAAPVADAASNAASDAAAAASSSLDAAFERLPRVFRPGAAAEEAVHDLGGLPSALADLLAGGGGVEASAGALATAASLPWALSLPLATLGLKLALTPLSLRSAAVLRSNLRLWTEAAGLAEQRAAKAAHWQRQEEQEGQAAGLSSSSSSPSSSPLSPTAATTPQQKGRLELASARVAVYGELRRQCGVPSPLWAVGNVAVQVPTFFYVAASVRAMAGGNGGRLWGGGGESGGINGSSSLLLDPAAAAAAATPLPPWPGFQTEGALWFPDLSLPAAVPLGEGAAAAAADSAVAIAAAAAAASPSPSSPSLPPLLLDPLLSALGLQLSPGASAAALVLPLMTTSFSLLAIRRGVAALGGAKGLAALLPAGARGAAAASPLARAALANLPRLAYALAAAALYFKLQAAPAVLLHWLASLSYTLALQQAVARSASVRRAMGLPPPAPPAALAALRALSATATPAAAALSRGGATQQQQHPQQQNQHHQQQAAPLAMMTTTPNATAFQSLKAQPTEGPIPEGADVLTPAQFLARVRADQAEGQADVLVVMAAHHSSRGDALSAGYCLDLALDAQPDHARALYARGQARSMRRDWPGAERDFCAAADALVAPALESGEGGEDGGGNAATRRLLRGQALYAAGGAAAGAGEHARALELYDEAARWWTAGADARGASSPSSSSPLGAETAAAAAASARHAPALLALARSRALAALGRRQEALDALDRALSAGQRASVTEGLRGLLQEARRRLLAAAAEEAEGGAGAGGGGGGTCR